jgi:hypothetical protein
MVSNFSYQELRSKNEVRALPGAILMKSACQQIATTGAPAAKGECSAAWCKSFDGHICGHIHCRKCIGGSGASNEIRWRCHKSGKAGADDAAVQRRESEDGPSSVLTQYNARCFCKLFLSLRLS